MGGGRDKKKKKKNPQLLLHLAAKHSHTPTFICTRALLFWRKTVECDGGIGGGGIPTSWIPSVVSSSAGGLLPVSRLQRLFILKKSYGVFSI